MSEAGTLAGPVARVEAASNDGPVFLSHEWAHHVVKLVQGSRARDEEFKKLTSGFTLSLLYLITDLPPGVGSLCRGTQVAIFVQLDKGTVRKLQVGTEIPREKPDFTIASSYEVAKQIFQGELNAATSFISRQIRVEPLDRMYRRPRFTARAVVTGNQILKIARQVPTVFPQEGQYGSSSG